MISNATTGVDPTQRAHRLHTPAGTRVRSVANPAEFYVKGSTVVADAAWTLCSAPFRPHALDIPGARTWSPPV